MKLKKLSPVVDNANMDELVAAAKRGSEKATRWAWAKIRHAERYGFRAMLTREDCDTLRATIARFKAELSAISA